ncbi:MAG: sulfotransferase domain-containing protein [Cyclobacteriaceae bacterium]
MNILSKVFKKSPNASPKPVIYNDDTFLVSYPKSGNTWVRFIIANLLKKDSDHINFHTAVNYVPEIGIHNEIAENLERPRILKSHQLYNSAFPKVVYLVRDPRDVYVSYYHYLKKRLPESTNFSQFLRDKITSPDSWKAHVDSWKDKSNVIATFKYEEMLANTFEEVSRLAHVLGIIVDKEKIEQAVKASSFSKMKQIEQENGRPFRNESDKATATSFVRKGKNGDWVNYFSSEDLEYLAQNTSDLANRFGYQL